MSRNGEQRIRLTYVVSQRPAAVRWIAFEWICRELDRERFDVSFILLSNQASPLGRYLEARAIPCDRIPYRGRRDLPHAIGAVFRHCREHHPHILHAHFTDACLAGLTGAYLAGTPVRIHTRHHTIPWFAPAAHSRISYDRLINALSTRIIAPSRLVEDVLRQRDRVRPGKVTLIYHGFDLEAFTRVPEEHVRRLRQKYALDGAYPVVGVVARYIELKGIQYVIEAFRALLPLYPRARLFLANAVGSYAGAIRDQLRTLPDGGYVEIEFEEDLFALYRLFDLFVHAPTGPDMEAFGQVYVEALAAGVPSVFTRSGIASEFIEHGRNAWVADWRNSRQILEGMREILENEHFRQSLIDQGRRSVNERFGIRGMIGAMEVLYVTLVEERAFAGLS